MSGGRFARLRVLAPWIAGAFFLLAGLLVWHRLRRIGFDEVRRTLASCEALDLGMAALFTLGSYGVLTLFDRLGVRTVSDSRLAYPKVALTSFTALSLGHTIGLAALSSATVRLRLYSYFGLSGIEVTRIVLFAGTTVALGLCGVAGAAGLFRRAAVSDLSGLPAWLVLALAASAWLAVAIYLSWIGRAGGRVRIRGSWHPVPSLRVAVLQVGIGCTNFMLVAAALYQLLGEDPQVSFFAFASLYAAGNALGILSHVPGGLGVLEAVVLTAVPGADAAAALILFRVVYYLIPFLLGAIAYAGFELSTRGRPALPSR